MKSMTELIRQMSKIQVPEDLLRQIDVEGLINDFRKNFKRLDDFRKTRSAYENRGFWKKLGDAITFDDTMENAQLDAVETQAAFSKAIGQLMVMSIVQSQRLQQQQEQLSTQQEIIKDQTQRIERHTFELQDQHELLVKQNSDLEKLVNDYFELRGLTQEGAKKLIAIANEVQGTRDALLRSVDESLERVSKQVNDELHQVAENTSSLKDHISQEIAGLGIRCSEVSADLKRIDDQWSKKISGMLEQTTTTTTAVSDFGKEVKEQSIILERLDLELAGQVENLNTRHDGISSKLNNISMEFSTYRSIVHGKLTKLYAALGLLAFGLAAAIGFAATRL